MNMLHVFPAFGRLMSKLNKALCIFLFIVGLCLTSIKASAQDLIEYALLSQQNILLSIDLLPPAYQLILLGAVYYSDGINSNLDSPCVMPVPDFSTGICPITVPTMVAVQFHSYESLGGVSWSTNATAEEGTLIVSNSNPRNANFIALIAGTYNVTAHVSIGNSEPFPITMVVTAQNAVTADAGANETININAVATLDGSGSTNIYNTPLTYEWEFISKPADSVAELSNATSVNPTFTADKAGQYVIQLTAATVANNVSFSDSATVTISTNVVPPIADAGTAQTVHPIAVVNLNGGQSYDPNGLPVTYNWTLNVPVGSGAVLSDSTAANPSFTVDILGTYTATLVVNNGYMNSTSAEVVINTSNSAPIANAGQSGSSTVGALTTLDGSGSTDADNDNLTYEWSFVTVPQGSQTTLQNAETVSASFTPDLPGTYVMGLVVSDGFTDSAQSTVQVLAISSISSTTQSVQTLQNIISGLPGDSFRNKNMQNTLLNKLNAVIKTISAGEYDDALSQMQNDILKKTNGCALTGAPNKTDWIMHCDAQGPVYMQIQIIISNLNNLN